MMLKIENAIFIIFPYQAPLHKTSDFFQEYRLTSNVKTILDTT